MRCLRQSLDARKRLIAWRRNVRHFPTTSSRWPLCRAGASAPPQQRRSAGCISLPRHAYVAPAAPADPPFYGKGRLTALRSTVSQSFVMSGVHHDRALCHNVKADSFANRGRHRGAWRALTGTTCSTSFFSTQKSRARSLPMTPDTLVHNG